MHTAAITDFVCYTDKCRGNETVTASTARQCCVDVEGKFFSEGRGSETCGTCKGSVSANEKFVCTILLLHMYYYDIYIGRVI